MASIDINLFVVPEAMLHLAEEGRDRHRHEGNVRHLDNEGLGSCAIVALLVAKFNVETNVMRSFAEPMGVPEVVR